MEYIVEGTRNDENRFKAPVHADSPDEAEERFLGSVENEDEFNVEEITPQE